MLLDQRLVTRYAKLHAMKNLIDKWIEEKRAELLSAFSRGARCPDNGPYLLALGEAQDRPNWKEEFFAHLVSEGASEEQAHSMLKVVAERPREKSPRLYCKVNPNYKRKFPIRLPA